MATKKPSKRGLAKLSYIPITVEVAFVTNTVRFLLRNGRAQHRQTVTPYFRLPNGTRFQGRFASPELIEAMHDARIVR